MLLQRFVLLAPVLTVVVSAQTIKVVSVTPRGNAVAASTATEIAWTFDADLDATSVSSRSFQVFGKWSGVSKGVVSVSGKTIRFVPSRPFFPGEAVTVTASRAVASTSGTKLARGFASQFWTRTARATGTLTLLKTIDIRQPREGRITAYGAYAGDLDGDGAPDLTIPNEDSHDVRVLMNDGCANFARPTLYGLKSADRPSTNEGADFNGDGILDYAIGTITGNSTVVFLGKGDGTFSSVTHYPTGRQTRGLAVLDVESDGDTDIVTANRDSSNLGLHRNLGRGQFAAPTFFDAGSQGETSIATADANNDGILDLFVGSSRSGTVQILLGAGDGTYTSSVSRSVGGESWVLATGDLNGDGNVDVVSSVFDRGRCAVLFGDGKGGLSSATQYMSGTWTIAVDLGDIDGDGDLDLVSSNFRTSDFIVFWNDGSGRFPTKTRLLARSAGSCAVLVDFDRDGDLDVVGIDEVADIVLFFEQRDVARAGVQRGSCTATLRVDNLANRAGFGAIPPHAIRGGTSFHVGLTSGSRHAWALFASDGRAPGLTTPFGLLNLALPSLIFVRAGVTDGKGEARTRVPVPTSLAGLRAAVQAATIDNRSAITLSNPEGLRVR